MEVIRSHNINEEGIRRESKCAEKHNSHCLLLHLDDTNNICSEIPAECDTAITSSRFRPYGVMLYINTHGELVCWYWWKWSSVPVSYWTGNENRITSDSHLHIKKTCLNEHSETSKRIQRATSSCACAALRGHAVVGHPALQNALQPIHRDFFDISFETKGIISFITRCTR